MMAHVCRFTAVFALALPAAIGTATGIAHASTIGAASTAPPTGSYSGSESQNGWGIKFYVSASGKSLLDIDVPSVGLDCTPSNTGFSVGLPIAAVAISPTGSFITTATQEGVVFGHPALFTYTFQGNFHGVAANGAERAAGTYAETVRYTDSVAHVCTSNTQSWYASRNAQPAQPSTAPPTGSYSGSESQNGWGIKFYVSASGKSLLDIDVPSVGLDCTPSNTGFSVGLPIAAVAISPTGSFITTATQEGVVFGHPALFTYTFQGNFHGVAANGAERAAGTYAETVRYTDSVAHVCTSNTQSWYASRNAQPAQPSTAPPTGSYSGSESQNGWGIKFYVSASGKSLLDIDVPSVGLDCTPSNTGFSVGLPIAAVAISPTGSFITTATQEGVVFGHPALFTYTFQGNFHGVAANGAERAAGTYAETVRYTDSVAHVCTSNTQSWYASLK